MFLILFILITAAVTLGSCFLSICDMNRNTNNFIRFALLMIAVTEFAVIVGPIFGVVQSGLTLGVLNFGVMLLTVASRMRRRAWIRGALR